MKKNIKLLTILILGLLITYIFVEKPHYIPFLKPQYIKVLDFIKNDSIRSLQWTHLTIKKEEQTWHSNWNSQLVKSEAIVELMNHVKNIMCTKELEFKEEYFENKKLNILITTTDSNTNIQLGIPNKLTGDFYLKLNAKVHLCKLDKEVQGFFKDEIDMELHKYIFLRDLFDINPTNLFYPQVNLPSRDSVKKMIVENKKNGIIEIDFNQLSVKPKLEVQFPIIDLQAFLNQFYQFLNFNNIFQAKPYSLSEPMASIKLLTDKETKIDLYRLHNDKVGFYLSINDSPYVYEINFENLHSFFVSISDFYNFRLLNEVDDKEIKLIMMNDSKIHPIKLLTMNPIKIEFAPDLNKDNNEDIEDLLNLFIQPNEYTPEFKKMFSEKINPLKKIEFLTAKNDFVLELKDDFVIYNLKQKYKINLTTPDAYKIKFRRLLGLEEE